MHSKVVIPRFQVHFSVKNVLYINYQLDALIIIYS